MKCPCKGCERRTITCHGICWEYKDWKQEHEERKLKDYQDRHNKPQLNRQTVKLIWKRMRWK